MVAPSKMSRFTAPFLVSRKIFGSGRSGVKLSSRATAHGLRISIPCAASPPMTFCQEKVTTSSFVQSRSCANAAEVASQITIRSGLSAIQSAFGTRAPEVVPFQVKTRSASARVCERSGSAPYSASITRQSASFSCLTASVTQPWPKLSQASMSTPRAPSIDHIAISTAPVSEAGTIPTR